VAILPADFLSCRMVCGTSEWSFLRQDKLHDDEQSTNADNKKIKLLLFIE
jgi:hypothetical protein